MEGLFRSKVTLLSVVLPVYNEGTLIVELVKRVKSNVQQITEDFEIVLVDDGSVDQTWESIVKEATQEKRVKGIKFSRNFGHHYAITAGLHNAGGEWVVVMDGDLQDRPEVIPDLYNEAQKGFEIVFVSRQNRPEKLYYRIAQKIFYWSLRKLSGVDFDARQANFSIINKKVVEAFKSFPENARFYASTIKWLGFKRSSILANHGQRFSGKPSYTLKKRVNLALDIIFSFSVRPLNFTVKFGILISIISMSIAVGIFFNIPSLSKLSNETLLFSVYFVGGSVLIYLGLIGAYIGRIFHETKKRPLFIVSESINL
jgi:glycosyltransferase involved in cell wall biosynthesis